MTAQRRPKGVTTSAFPPFSLTFTCQQATSTTGNVTVSVSAGRHIFLRRRVVFQYDGFDGTPIVVEASMYRWIAWLLEEERARRGLKDPSGPLRRAEMPQWPSAETLGALAALDELDGTTDRS